VHEIIIIIIIIIIIKYSKLYYDRSVTTDLTVHNNRPDIITLEKTIKEASLIGAAIPNSQTFAAPPQRSSRKKHI
jgi:hypothetical protein